MKKYLISIIILGVLIANLNVKAQIKAASNSNTTKYERGFVFKEGVYLSFEDFKMNNPIPFENIDLKNGKPFDFRELMDEEARIKNKPIRIFINDTTINSELHAIWGYSNGRNIYINSKEKGIIRERQVPDSIFYGMAVHVDVSRVAKIGALCHFTDFDDIGFKGESPYFPNKKIKVDEYIIIMATGEIYNFDIEGMSIALEDDDELLTLFLNQSYNKKKDKLKEVLYSYLNLYNKKHPIYFPK